MLNKLQVILMDSMLYILLKLLKAHGYKIKVQELRERLFSDPDKSAVALINTLDYFEVKNVVANVPESAFNELPKSFIAQIKGSNQLKLVLATKCDDKKVKFDSRNKPSTFVPIRDFLNSWTGFVIAIEKNASPPQKKPRKQKINYCIILSTLLATYYIGITSMPFLKSVYFSLALIGVYASYLVVKEKLASLGNLSKFCVGSKIMGCQSVVNSDGAIFFKKIDLADASIVYFSFISISFIFFPIIILFKALSLLSLPLILYSVYYQLFIIKKICVLCLGIVGILLLQFVVITMMTNDENINLLTLLPTSLLLSLITVSWMNIKRMYLNQILSEELSLNNLTFKRNYHLFLAYYDNLPRVETNEDSIFDIYLGNPNADVRILTVTNPLCEFCFETYNVFMDLLKKYENEIVIKFRFFISDMNRNNAETKIAERLIDLFLNEKDSFEDAFQHWYAKKTSIQEWFNKWGYCKNESINEILNLQRQWSVNSNVQSRPSIFINGKYFPKFYNPEDIRHFIRPLIDFEGKKKNTIVDPLL
ncbi:vitamin K epoxide reductase family protein [Croceiramulus getboli]|nr:vitamin K epoxide reductase family protein [Flavobacteriaceae bacterium YJPT1-3]